MGQPKVHFEYVVVAEGTQAFGIQQQTFNRIRQSLHVAGFIEHATAGRLDQFRKRSRPRLHDGKAGGKRFDDIQPERLAVKRGHTKNR